MDNHHETGDGDTVEVVPTQQSPAPAAAEDTQSRRPDTGGSSTKTKSPALSVTATVLAAAGGLVRGSSDTTPPADHFVALPGGDDEAIEKFARYPAFKPLKPKKSDGGPTKHGILEEPATLGGGGGASSKWGVEELLGSREAGKSSSRKGFAASAKSTIVSGLGKLTAVAAKSVATGDGGDQMVEQPCEYVAMSTPCESPVNMATGTKGGGSFHPPASSSIPTSSTTTTTAPAFKPSASSRAGLAARLGSALQSWTSASGRDSVGGAPSPASPPREGRPGPLGAKYTQRQRRPEPPEVHLPCAPLRQADCSQVEPSSAYHQLSDGQQEKPPASPGAQRGSGGGESVLGTGGEEDRVSGHGGGCSVAGTRLLAAQRKGGGGRGGPEKHEAAEEEEEGGLQEEGCAVPDMIELEPGNSKAEGEGLIRLEAAAAAAAVPGGGGESSKKATQANPPPPPLSSHHSTAAQATAVDEQQQQVGGGAEAGAGAAAAKAPPTAPGKESNAHSSIEKAIGHDNTRQRRSGQEDEPEETTDNENDNNDRSGSGGGDSGEQSSDATKKKSKRRVVGLWELKAQRSRLEHALAEAEVERDVERARAREAADRVEEAVERLERLRRRRRQQQRQQRCETGRGAGARAEAAAVGIVG